MDRGEKITINKWIGLPNDNHTWAFYYYLKNADDVEVKKRVRGDNKVDIMIKEVEIYDSKSG